ncbi:MAG: glycosyltransferase, partial [Deltaproteobacteria bacterium]|nr:glycosyltransferase [Deltaproteobacteria bacterium]
SSGELYGGVEEFIYTFSEYLKENVKIEFLVVLFHEGKLFEKLKKNGVGVELVASAFKYDLSLPLKLIRTFRKHNINLVHTHGYKSNILAGMAARFCGIKTVKTEHGRQESSRGFSGRRMSFNLKLDRFITGLFVDEIVYVSKDIQSFYQKIYRKPSQTVIYNGIKPIALSEDGSVCLDRNFINIGIVGRIAEVKGHIHLINAVKRLPDLDRLRVLVFGEGPLKETLQNYCEKNGLSNKIIFMGFKDNIHEYISQLDIFIMPSLHEGLPYALLEAMFLRVPVIASNVGGIKEILENNVDSILIEPSNPEVMADAIRGLVENKDLRKRLKENAFKKVAEKFTIGKMASEYLRVYLRSFKGKICNLPANH